MKKKIVIIAFSIIALAVSISLILLLTNDKKIKTYNVSFETNGGTEINKQVVNEGEKVIKPNDPEKEGYVFVQWIYKGKTYDFSSSVKNNLVLKAEWIEKKEEVEIFTVKFNSDGGTTIPNQIITKGNKVTMPTNPTKEGYNFVEWQYNGVKYNFETIIESNLELIAKWEQVETKNNKPTNNNNEKPVNSGINNNNASTNNTTTKPSKNEVKLSTPTITKGGFGFDGEGNLGMELKLNSIDGITGVEVYGATTENGTYTLKETVKKENLTNQAVNVWALKGQHLFFKVRTYVKNSAGTFYSGYSNVMELDNSN